MLKSQEALKLLSRKQLLVRPISLSLGTALIASIIYNKPQKKTAFKINSLVLILIL
jgi:hypothetical protein